MIITGIDFREKLALLFAAPACVTRNLVYVAFIQERVSFAGGHAVLCEIVDRKGSLKGVVAHGGDWSVDICKGYGVLR